jgi:uncharacterized damage-inducible protein DinB
MMTMNDDSLVFLIRENMGILEQGSAILDALSDEEYSRPVDGSGASSSLGKHFRHVINFYESLLTPEDGLLDYDRRRRDPDIEQQAQVASSRMKGFRKEFTRWIDEPVARPRISGIFIQRDKGLLIPSDLGRELKFVLEHSIHHYAIIGLIIRQRGFDIPREFGVAPSTLAWERSGRS